MALILKIAVGVALAPVVGMLIVAVLGLAGVAVGGITQGVLQLPRSLVHVAKNWRRIMGWPFAKPGNS